MALIKIVIISYYIIYYEMVCIEDILKKEKLYDSDSDVEDTKPKHGGVSDANEV